MKTNLILQRSLFFSISHLTTNFNQLSNRSISLVRKSAFLVCIGLLGFNSWGQIAQRGSAISNSSGTANMSSIQVNKPTGIVSGDIMIVSILQNETDNDNGGLSSANLTGWTLIDGRTIRSEGTSNGDNAWFGTVLYRVADGTEGTSFTFALPNSRADMALISIVAFSGVTATNGVKADGTAGGPFDVDPGTLNVTNASTSTASSITTASSNSAIIMLSLVNNDRTFSDWTATSPSTFTEIYENLTTSADDGSIGAAWNTKAAAGTTGDGVVTLSNSDRSGAILLALKPCVTANAGSALSAICRGGTSESLGGSVGGSATGGTWSANVVGGSFSPNATTLNASYTPSSTYTGTVTLTLTSSGGSCGTATASKTLTVLPSPTVVSASSSASTICAGGSVNLTSSATSNSNTTTTLLNENFNSTPTGWTTTNTSNGGTTGNAAWSLRANGYSYTYASDPAVIFNSNDNSQFYLTNSASQGSANTKTTLQSPAFSTVGLSAASLSFYQYFRAYSGTSAIVEISTNGTSWTALATYTTDKGNISPFVQETINLSSYLNQANVSIRFRYDGGWGWYWAVDNVSITGTLSTPPSASYAWTSSPGAFTSSTQNPTGVSPSATTTYTVTATNNYGCTATASTTVTVNSVTAGSIGSNQTICSGGNPTAFTSTAGTGSGTISYRWERNTNLTTPSWSTVTGQTSATYDVPNGLTATTQYRRITISTLNSVACESAATSTVQVTVNPTSVGGTVAGSATVCTGTNSTTLTLSGHTGSITRWESSTSSNFSSAVTNIANITTSLIATNLTTTTYYRAVVTSGSCAPVNSATGTITVTSANTVGAASSTPTSCIYNAITNITHTTTGATGISNSGVAGANGLPSGVAASWASNTITISGTPWVSGTFNYTIPLTGGCGSVSATGTITIKATPTGNFSYSNYGFCSSVNTAQAITSNFTDATGTFSASAGLNLNTTTGGINPSLSSPNAYVVTYSVPASTGCPSYSTTTNVTIDQAGSGTITYNPSTICLNASGTVSPTITNAGGSGTPWFTVSPNGLNINNSGVITPIGSAAGTYTITYNRPSSGLCAAYSNSTTVNISALASNTVGAASSTPTLCINSALTNITHSTTGATGIGTAIGLPAGVTASWASNTITISGTPTASGTFNYTIPLTGGCSSVNATGTITVNQPTTSITIAGTTIGNGDYLWNGNINSNGNVSGNWYVLNNGIYSVPNQAPQETHEVFVVNSSQAVSCVSSDLTIPNAGNFSSENIHIGQDANISVGNGASLNVRGNFVNNGNVNAGSGTVIFTGNSAVQIISGTGALNFSNVKIDKSAGKVSLNNDISISGTLEFQQGNLDLNGKTLNYSGGYGITTTNGGLIADAAQSKLNLTSSSQITDGLFHNGEIYDLTIATNASVSSSGSYTISNSLIVGNGATFTKEDGYTIIFKGDVVNNGAIVDGTSGIFGGSIVFNNTVNQTISGQPVSIANLEVVKASGKLIVSTPITVTGKLEMNGNIDNPSSLITLGNSSEPGSLVYTSGTITGALRRYFPATPGSSTYFPVGNASNTRGATIAFTSSPGANQYLTVKYQGGAAGGTAPLYTGLPLTTGDGVLIQNFDEEGYWEINPTANDYAQSINTTPYTITLQMKNLSNVNDRSTVRVIKAAGSNNPSQHHGAWTALTFDANAVSGNSNSDFTVTGTSTGFSWFGAGSGNNNPLPVELVSFSGLCEEGVVNLTWQTASEFSSSHFDVEKSRDGENWQLMSTVPSAGTSNELITYQSFDKNGTNGNNYYRLRQVDIDGTEKVYDPINVSCTEETPGYFSSFPNPSGTSFQVVVNNKELIGVCTLNMVDATGKVIEQREIEVKDGINMFVINQELTPGIYFMNITNGSKSTSMLRHAIK